MIDLTPAVSLVTGAATGIGRGIADALAAAGSQVQLADVQAELGQAVADGIQQRGGRAEFVEADIADEEAVAQLAQHVQGRHGRLDVLVNNAGVAMFQGIADTSPEDWDRLLAVDLRGVYLVTRACLPLLSASPNASITCIASVHALATVPWMTAYAAAKGGLVAMVRSLAQELGPQGIRVNAISPGFVRTPLFESWLATEPDREAAEARVREQLPLRRIAEVSDIANVVLFLSSGLAAAVTGANIVVDSGLTTRLAH